MDESPRQFAQSTAGRSTGLTLGIIGSVVGGIGLCAGVACAGIGYVLALAAIILGIVGLVTGRDDENSRVALILSISAIALGLLTLLISCGNSVLGVLLLQDNRLESLFR